MANRGLRLRSRGDPSLARLRLTRLLNRMLSRPLPLPCFPLETPSALSISMLASSRYRGWPCQAGVRNVLRTWRHLVSMLLKGGCGYETHV